MHFLLIKYEIVHKNVSYLEIETKKVKIKSNRTVLLLEKTKLNLENDQSIKISIKFISFALQLIEKVFTNESDSTEILHIISNNLKNNANQMHMIYKKR